MLTQMPMLMQMPMLIQVRPGLLTEDLLITTTAANATEGAPMATLWITTGVHADALESARTATLWTTVAASVSPGHADVCASPAPNRTTTPTNGRISVQLITTMTHAESTVIATGTAIGMANQLQVGWQEQIFGCLEPMLNVMFSPAHSMFLYSLTPHNVFSLCVA